MTYSPGLTSGSMVILDMMTLLFSQVELMVGEILCLVTLLACADARGREKWIVNNEVNKKYQHFLQTTKYFRLEFKEDL